MTNYIREMSGKQFLKRLAENPTVIIPTGACAVSYTHLTLPTILRV